MNCRDAQHQLFAQGAAPSDLDGRDGVAAHVAGCPDCRRIQQELTGAIAAWRAPLDAVTIPDPEREWHAVRRRIRAGESVGEDRLTWRNALAWLAVPLTAAAAVAVAVLIAPRPADSSGPALPSTQVARAISVEVPGRNTSTMVYVDDKSGWLIVWASDVAPNRG